MLDKYFSILSEKIGQKQKIEENLQRRSKNLENLEKNLKNIEKAQIVIQEVAKKTQEQVKFHIEDIVGLALESVFPDQYNFVLEFEIKRNKTEANIYFTQNGEKMKPMDSMGGGVIDVASFALRVALWSLKLDKKNNTMILDEPMKWLSEDLQERAGEMMKKISEKLKIQFLMVSHVKNLINSSDKVFNLKILKNSSKITEIYEN